MNLSELKVNKTVDEKDGMLKGKPDYYFKTGRSAMEAIKKSLATAGRKPESVTRVLDYACGYGRVLRWLMAGFSHADIIGVDMDAKAVASTQRTLGADTRVLDITLSGPLDEPVDLIWVGSLFTHLPEAESQRVLSYLHDHLLPNGVLVITTHGTLVEGRIRSRERPYGLNEEGVVEALRGYDETGYGFASYPALEGYGASLVTQEKMTEMIRAAGLEVTYFEARGWVQHQDVFGIRRRA